MNVELSVLRFRLNAVECRVIRFWLRNIYKHITSRISSVNCQVHRTTHWARGRPGLPVRNALMRPLPSIKRFAPVSNIPVKKLSVKYQSTKSITTVSLRASAILEDYFVSLHPNRIRR